VAERSGSLRGYWFLAARPERRAKAKSARAERQGPAFSRGFFVGYLVRADEFAFLAPEPPECLVFAFVRPVGSRLHRQLVGRPGSPLRNTSEYIRWLTHRPPRFVFYSDQIPTLVRHLSMHEWPRAKHEHFSRNFFIETLAWLVRSGLVHKLPAASSHHAKPGQEG
jgi:hypothetical protein